MDWESIFQGAGTAGISTALSLGAGFLNRGLSQRDAMQAQADIAHDAWKRRLLAGPISEVEGLRRAGINPLLRYGSGGSGLAPGYSMPGIAPAVNPGAFLSQGVASGVSSAVDLFRAEGQVMKNFAEVDKIASEIAQIQASTELTVQQKENAIADQRRIFADEVLKIGQSVLNSEQLKILDAQRDVLESQAAINKWVELSEIARAQLAEAGVPLAEADAAFYETLYGKFLRYLERTKDAINPFGGSGIGKPFGGPKR